MWKKIFTQFEQNLSGLAMKNSILYDDVFWTLTTY